jgi:hypothetical protein
MTMTDHTFKGLARWHHTKLAQTTHGSKSQRQQQVDLVDLVSGNALNWVSVRPNAPLLGYDVSPTTHASSFLKNCSSTYSYPLVLLPIAVIRSRAASECTAAGPAGAARCCPLQVAWPRPSRRSCSRCLPSATCNHCCRPATYKRRQVAASGEHHTSTSLHFAKQQEDVAMKAHVARVHFNYFIYFRSML